MKPTLKPIPSPIPKPIPSTHPFLRPFLRPSLNPFLNTLKIPPSKAWCRLHRANATSPRAAHCIATSSQRIGLRILCITAHRANATSPRAAHRKQSAHRAGVACTDNQPVEVRASHPVQRPRIALRGPHTLLSTLRWFRFVWFVVLTFLKFNISTLKINVISWLIRHTG